MANKGRSTRGIKHHNSRLTEEQILNIVKDNRMQKEIAADYGVKQQAISKIKRKERWKYLWQ